MTTASTSVGVCASLLIWVSGTASAGLSAGRGRFRWCSWLSARGCGSLAKHGLLDLADAGGGHRLDDDDLLGDLELGQVPDAGLDHLLGAGAVGVEHDERHDGLVPDRVGAPDDGRFADPTELQ